MSVLLGAGALISIVGATGCSSAGESTDASQTAAADDSEALITANQAPVCQNDVHAARVGSARYHDVNNAIADGFVQISPCITDPTGVTPGSVGAFGTVGIHYINLARIDGTAAAGNPQVLVYVPEKDGSLKLVSTEYLVPIFQDGAVYTNAAVPPTHPQPAPHLFGQKLIGPVAPHFPGGPWHYEIHAWVWSFNPNGLTAPSSPRVTCNPQ